MLTFIPNILLQSPCYEISISICLVCSLGPHFVDLDIVNISYLLNLRWHLLIVSEFLATFLLLGKKSTLRMPDLLFPLDYYLLDHLFINFLTSNLQCRHSLVAIQLFQVSAKASFLLILLQLIHLNVLLLKRHHQTAPHLCLLRIFSNN